MRTRFPLRPCKYPHFSLLYPWSSKGEGAQSSLAPSWGNQNNSISFSIFWYSFMNYPRFLNNGCWYMDTTISIWKECQEFWITTGNSRSIGRGCYKTQANRAEFCLGSMPALRRQTTEEQHYFALRRVESDFLTSQRNSETWLLEKE